MALFRATHGIDTDKILIVYAGTFGRINGVSYLVRLASLLRSDNRFFFLLVGDGHDFTEVHSLARSLGVLHENLMILGSLPKSQMPDVLSAADISTSLFIPISEMKSILPINSLMDSLQVVVWQLIMEVGKLHCFMITAQVFNYHVMFKLLLASYAILPISPVNCKLDATLDVWLNFVFHEIHLFSS